MDYPGSQWRHFSTFILLYTPHGVKILFYNGKPVGLTIHYFNYLLVFYLNNIYIFSSI